MKLVWSRRLLRQLDGVRRYHRDLPPDIINGVLERLEVSLWRICEYPESAPPGRESGTRELVITGTNYILVYRCDRGVITVLAVFHSVQDWQRG